MAFGKSIELKALDTQILWRKPVEWEQKPRDRSLSGKARIRARKRSNKS